MKLSAKAKHVQDTLRALGLDVPVVKLAESTRTAAEAASAVGCTDWANCKISRLSCRSGPHIGVGQWYLIL